MVSDEFGNLEGAPSFLSQVTTPTAAPTSPFAESNAMLAEEMGYGNDFLYGGAGANGATPSNPYLLTASNPTALYTLNPSANPTTLGVSGTGTVSTAGTTGGTTQNLGLTAGLAKAVGGAADYLSNWVERSFLIIIGLVIAGIGVWHIMDPGGLKRALPG
jgi:hypothetical protein